MRTMKNLFKTIALCASGAAAMYYFDPERGHRRRALMRDRLDLASQDASDFARIKSRQAAHRVRALAAAASAPFSGTWRAGANDYPLHEQLQARFDQMMAHPNVLDRARDSMRETTQGMLRGSFFKTLALCAASVAAMYYLDPEMGRRRRALVRDKLNSVSHDASDFARAKGKRAADRVKGLVASARAPFAGASGADSDHQLRQRIRSQLGRLVSHPKAIEVEVTQGRVRLDGHVLARDVEPLLSAVSAMPGVHGVDNQLSVHDQAGSLPELQGSDSPQMKTGSRSRQMLPLVAVAAPLAVMLRKRRNARLARESGAPLH